MTGNDNPLALSLPYSNGMPTLYMASPDTPIWADITPMNII